jgi:maleate cis-trans isomerase
MPTIDILPEAEKKVGKPVISSVAATMWRALKVSQVNSGVAGFGSLLERKYDE